MLQLAVFATALFGIKLCLIRHFGNDTPFWDQWGAELSRLFEPMAEGRFPWDELLAPHNEHRIFTTRMLSVMLLSLNGLWSPILEMVANAAISVAALGVLAWALARGAGQATRSSLYLFTAAVSAVPFAWENTLWGFQGQFYQVLLFSSLAIWLLLTAVALSVRWWIGLLMAVMAYLSFASGAFAPAAVAGVLVLRFLVRRRQPGEGVALLLMVLLFAAFVFATPSMEGHSALKAASVRHLLASLGGGLAWPLPVGWSGALVRNLPWLVLLGYMLKGRAPADDRRWVVIAMGLWVAGQTLAIAYGRNAEFLTSRYLDLYSIGLIVNFAALASLVPGPTGRARMLVMACAAAWTLAGLGFLARVVDNGMPAGVLAKRSGNLTYEANLRKYLANGDRSAFEALPSGQVPYHDVRGLMSMLDSPAARAILPANLQHALVPLRVEQIHGNAFISGGAYPTTPPCNCVAWGSYSAGGDAAIGEMLLHFDLPAGPQDALPMRLDVAGYPSDASRIELNQDGRVRRLRPGNASGEHWAPVYFKVHPGQFSLRLTDVSPTAWIAVSAPVRAGRLDPFVNWLLGHSMWVVALGAALACAALLSTLPASPSRGAEGKSPLKEFP